VTDEDGGKVEESMMKHDKIFLGEVICSMSHVSQELLKYFALAQILEPFLGFLSICQNLCFNNLFKERISQ